MGLRSGPAAAGITPTVTHEWTLWAVAVSCVLHPTEEYFTGWQRWAHQTLGIVMPTATFVIANSLLAVCAFLLARQFVGGDLHLVSSFPLRLWLMQSSFTYCQRSSKAAFGPGLYTALLLYVPFSSWAVVNAHSTVPPQTAIATAIVAGILMMVSVSTARWLSGAM